MRTYLALCLPHLLAIRARSEIEAMFMAQDSEPHLFGMEWDVWQVEPNRFVNAESDITYPLDQDINGIVFYGSVRYIIETTPIDDGKPHTEGICECQPGYRWESGTIHVMHNSFDGREILEEARYILGHQQDKERWINNYYTVTE